MQVCISVLLVACYIRHYLNYYYHYFFKNYILMKADIHKQISECEHCCATAERHSFSSVKLHTCQISTLLTTPTGKTGQVGRLYCETVSIRPPG